MSLAQDLALAQKELNIAGIDEIGVIEEIEGAEDIEGIDEIGALRKRFKAAKRVLGMPMGRIPGLGDQGAIGVLPLPCTAALPLAAAGVGNLVFTPNRNVSIRDCVLDMYTLAATAAVAQRAACKVTNITIQGRPQMAGVGEIPLTAFQNLTVARKMPFLLWQNCSSGQNIIITFRNDDAATAILLSGMLWVSAAF